MKLIPMSDFVLQQEFAVGNEFETTDIFYNKVLNYAKFLKQPLTLSMFVPCDERGNVLEEPEKYMDIQNIGSLKSHATEHECIDAEAYHQAKSRCLFEGVEIRKIDDQYFIEYEDSGFFLSEEYTIECLESEQLTLTETAITQIFK